MFFLGPKDKDTIWDRMPPSSYRPHLVKINGGLHRSQIFKLNQIILNSSRLIAFLLIWDPLALGEGQVGGGEVMLGFSQPKTQKNLLKEYLERETVEDKEEV